MGNISGNQDRVRFISYADGSVDFSEDGKNAGWTRSISNQNGSLGYERLAMLHAFNYAVPGIPVIYYGDEIGLPGANDPDNRRMMEFAGLDSNAVWLKSQVRKLNALRANHMSLLYGQTEISQTENLILTRQYGNETTCVVFNASDSAQTITINTPKGFEQALWKNSFNHKLELGVGTLQVTLPPRSFEYIIGTL
jgi:glycosidase